MEDEDGLLPLFKLAILCTKGLFFAAAAASISVPL
jgi:hypothetical protein